MKYTFLISFHQWTIHMKQQSRSIECHFGYLIVVWHTYMYVYGYVFSYLTIYLSVYLYTNVCICKVYLSFTHKLRISCSLYHTYVCMYVQWNHFRYSSGIGKVSCACDGSDGDGDVCCKLFTFQLCDLKILFQLKLKLHANQHVTIYIFVCAHKYIWSFYTLPRF